MAIDNDPGGPMFFPMFVVAVLLFAVAITFVLAGASLLSDLLRRHFRIPIWLPPLLVFACATAACWLFFDGAHPAIPPIAGVVVALAFIVHWAAVSTIWFLPHTQRRTLRLRGVDTPAYRFLRSRSM